MDLKELPEAQHQERLITTVITTHDHCNHTCPSLWLSCLPAFQWNHCTTQNAQPRLLKPGWTRSVLITLRPGCILAAMISEGFNRNPVPMANAGKKPAPPKANLYVWPLDLLCRSHWLHLWGLSSVTSSSLGCVVSLHLPFQSTSHRSWLRCASSTVIF